MSQNFWDAFWGNLLSGLAIVLILSIVGFIAKHRVSKNLKKFISGEVDEVIKQIKDTGKK